MAITKIQSNAFPATIDLSNIDLTIGAGEILTANIADNNVTHAKLHTDMDLSGKNVTLPTLSQSLVVTGNLQLGDGGIIGAQTSAGNVSFYAGGTYPGGIVKSFGGQAGGDLEFRTQTTAATGEGPVRLKIEGTGNIVSNQRFFFNGGSNGIFWSTDGSSEDLWHIQVSNDGLDFVESGVASNRLFLEPGGNVGIGTSNPTSKLDITGVGVGETQIRLATGSNTSDDATYSQEGGRFSFYQKQDESTYRRNLDISANGDNSWGGRIRFLTNPDNDGTAVGRMIINQQGRVGIGTENPSYPFDVNDTTNLGYITNVPESDNSVTEGSFRSGMMIYRSFNHYFPNGVSNLGLRIYFQNSSLWTDGEVWITSDYSNGNRTGQIHYAWGRHAHSNSNYGTYINQQYSYGNAASGFEFNHIGFDSNVNQQYMEFRKLGSEGNPIYLLIKVNGMPSLGPLLMTAYGKRITW
jgi:hypothetical protein